MVDNLRFHARLAGRDDPAWIEQLAGRLGLTDFLKTYPEQLSGGQQQRAAIARAVVTRPQILLADEPTGNVDDAYAVRLLFLLQELHREGTTIVIATHNQTLIDQFRHPVLNLQDGILHHSNAEPRKRSR